MNLYSMTNFAIKSSYIPTLPWHPTGPVKHADGWPGRGIKRLPCLSDLTLANREFRRASPRTGPVGQPQAMLVGWPLGLEGAFGQAKVPSPPPRGRGKTKHHPRQRMLVLCASRKPSKSKDKNKSRVSPRRRGTLLLLRQKESTQRKGDPQRVEFPPQPCRPGRGRNLRRANVAPLRTADRLRP